MKVTAMPPLRSLTLAIALLGAAPIAGHAAENRLLPFWGQPFPSGFTRHEVGLPDALPPCPGARHWRHRGDRARWDRCPAVLHARD